MSLAENLIRSADIGSAGRLHAECGLVEGDVPETLAEPSKMTRGFQIGRDAFLMRLPSGLAFHYRRGVGTTYSRAAGVSDAEIALFFEGSVYGAIAWLNGFVPLHASAVVHDGVVHAFTGNSGEGKSTLCSALGARGLQPCADDVVVLDLSEPARVMAIPGHRRLKLWADALEMTERAAQDRVRPGIDKFYVADDTFHSAQALPFHRLYMLDSANDPVPAIVEITGIERFAAIRASYYRPGYVSALGQEDSYFAAAARLSREVAIARFSRPRDRSRFAAGIDLIEADIRGTRVPVQKGGPA